MGPVSFFSGRLALAAPERQGKPLSFFGVAIALFAALIIAAQIGITPASAQFKDFDKLIDKGKQEPGRKPPAPKLRTVCTPCQGKLDALRAALIDYYLDLQDQAHNLAQSSNDADKDPNERSKLQAQSSKLGSDASNGFSLVDPSGKKEDREKARDERKSKPGYKKPDVDLINKLIKDLLDCIANCKDDTKPVTPAPPEAPTITVKVPPCFKDGITDDREDWIAGVEDIIKSFEAAGPRSDPRQERQRLANIKYLKERIEEAKAKPRCPEGTENPKEETPPETPKHEKEKTGGGSGYVPGRPPREGGMYVSADGNEWCTYGRAKPQYVAVIPGDLGAPAIAVSNELTDGGIVIAHSGDRVEEKSMTPAARPIAPADKMQSARPQEPKKPAAPQTDKSTDKQPSTPVTTTETPSTPEVQKHDDTVVNFKGNQIVLQQKPTGQEVPTQILASLIPADTPGLPTDAQNKAALDKNFDKEPMQVTLDGKGEGKVTIPADELADYMPDAKPGQSYRLDFNMFKNSGGVVETTGKPVPKTDITKGVVVSTETFKIGSRTFQRRGYSTPYDVNFSNARGEKTDYCRTAEPGLPFDLQSRSFSALNQELPGKVINFNGVGSRGGRRWQD